MSGFNKATSFVLGLIVVLVFLFVFGSRVNLSDKLIAFRPKNITPTVTASPSPTPIPSTKSGSTSQKKGFFESLFGRKTTPTPTPKPTTKPTDIVFTKGTSASTTPKTIPQTGSPTILLPILISALGSGIYLRKKN